MNVVLFASAYFDEPLWTNKQHIASRLAARGHTVMYVEPGFARHVLTGRFLAHAHPLAARRDEAAIDLAARHGVRVPSGHLAVLSPMLLPLRRGADVMVDWAFRRLAAMIQSNLADLVAQEVPPPILGSGVGASAASRCAPWVLYIYHPAGVRLLDHLSPDLVVYDCVDDIGSQPHVARRAGVRDRLLTDEGRLLKDADLVLTTSRHLYETRRPSNPSTHYVPNVADYDHFSRAQAGLPEPSILSRIARPRAVFAGALDPYKLDYGLLDAIATARPALSLVLAGPESTVGRHDALARLRRHPGVHAIGPVPYDDLPALLGHCDVLLMPYASSEHTRHVFPLKFFEFLATGRPVVSTPLPALGEFAGTVPFPADTASWLAAIDQALAAPEAGRDARIALARAHTWEHRVARIEELLAAALAAREGS